MLHTIGKKWFILTIVSNLCILVGAGHGAGPLGLFEVVAVTNISRFTLSFSASYEESLAAASWFALIGQILLITAIVIKNDALRFRVGIAGLLSQWLGFFYLTHNYFAGIDDVSRFSFVTGIPFLIFSGLLTYKMIRYKFAAREVYEE